MANQPKDRWDKGSVVGTWLGAVLIPVALLVLGHWFSTALKEKELRAECVKQSIQIISETDAKEMPAGLRLYALNVLKASSPVPIPPELESHLLQQEPARDQYWTGENDIGGCILRLTSAGEPDLSVYVDGQLQATTPASIFLRPGRHQIGFSKKDGKVIASRIIHLDHDTVTELICDPDPRAPSIESKRTDIGRAQRSTAASQDNAPVQ